MVAIATVLNVLNLMSFITGWDAFNSFAGIDAQSLPIILLVNMLAILVGFGALVTYMSYRKE